MEGESIRRQGRRRDPNLILPFTSTLLPPNYKFPVIPVKVMTERTTETEKRRASSCHTKKITFWRLPDPLPRPMLQQQIYLHR
jgi:hypothetical protein